jgi:hypothetical protein
VTILLTTSTGSCAATLANTTCYLLQTELVVNIKTAISPLMAAYLAYGRLESGMLHDVYVKDKVKKLTYGASLSIPVKPVDTLDAVHGARSHKWVLGTSLGVLGGVLLGLMALAAKKRQDKHDEMEKALPDGDSSADTSVDHSDQSRTNFAEVRLDSADVA